MEQVQTLFREGVLSHLEQLETLSHNLAEKQEQSRRQEDVLLEKREMLLQLREQREELRAKIQQQRKEIQVLSATDEGGRLVRQPSTYEALQDLRLEEMSGAMQALFFTGISGKKTDDGFCFCLSTAFEGHYLDSYYVQVQNMENPRISHHSIPAFIPLRKIAKHLQSNLKKFLCDLSDHLNGFAGRKFQADRLQDAPGTYVPDTLQRNSLHTVISFSYNVTIDGQTFCFSAKLLYGVVTGVLPTEALVTCPEDAGPAQEAAASHSALFRSTPLHTALESLTA